ncbi:MAG TPA: lysylphosphatidylglycerol synthase transmembrane domain-containing protein [Bryobacteraceae bacterium]|nr:lysylphosphatidylglycerol synthase transmembrane domain-containing protein [Bryobacteraceae bacterium]
MSIETAPLRPVERGTKFRSWALIVATSLISLVCMGWVLNGAGLQHIWSEVRHMHYSWVAGAVLADICVYLLHAWRWRLLLRPIGKVSFIQAVESIYVGLFANEVLPLRAGEVIRCFLLSKFTAVPLSVTFASALIERIFDGIWLLACFFICLHIGKLPGVLLHGGYILAVLISICAVVLGYAMYARKQSLDLIFGISWPKWFNTLIEDLHQIGHSRYLYFSFLVSGLYMMAQILPIYLLVRANQLSVAWTASFTMMVLLRLTSIVPQAPGNLGSFQWVTARTLIMFGLGSGHAKRFSLILWAVVTIPLIVIGFIALALEGINMTHLQQQASAAARDRGKTSIE